MADDPDALRSWAAAHASTVAAVRAAEPAATLRLAAHLITATSWSHGHHPALVTLTDPTRISWLATAAAAGFPVVFLTHHHTADGLYHPAARTLLLTTHQPPETPPPVPASSHHCHLPPGPTPAQLARVVSALLSPAAAGIPDPA
jgi:hypothetical protein